uniref:Dachshund d n=1 Tax=Gadus morhua TaxID=8049 RepID=A0A8C4ZTI9_GADMO
MAVPATLIPQSPLIPPPPPISTPATTSPSSTTSSPSPSLGVPPGQNLFRSELLATSGSPGIPTPTGTLPGKPVYSTPSPVENTPQNNECKMVELRGAKVASFTVDGCELICLPQAFDLFLKHLVGGLHTVYTKLKRLEITPVVCNVEQVRILRGLGAIQPGVNRCKLISRKDFETLYNDCTNASKKKNETKKTASLTSPDTLHLISNLLLDIQIKKSNNAKKKVLQQLSHSGSTTAAGESLANPIPRLSISVSGLELPFMMMPHPLIPVSLPPASVTMAMSQMNHLSTIANMAAAAQGQSLPSRMVTSVIKDRVPDSPSPAPSLEDHRRPGSHPSSHRSSSVSSSPPPRAGAAHHNGLSMNHALLGLSPNMPPGPKEGDLAHDMSHEAKRMHHEKEENLMCPSPGFPSPFLFPDGLSSIETLLTNIQGLLKVAIDNARAQEKQVQLEKTELKMELFRERELRETLEKTLAVEQKNRAIVQKRLKKEKKAKRKLQEALEYESKRREQVEMTLKQPSPSDSMRSLNGQTLARQTPSPVAVRNPAHCYAFG